MKLSIVIPTRNRRIALLQLLESLRAQTLSRAEFEVIVIDDGSNDETPQAVETYARSGLDVRCVGNPGDGVLAARNYGASLGRGEILALMDDDVVCRPDCLENALGYFEGAEMAVVEANLLIRGTEQPMLKRADAQGFNTGAIFIRRAAFVQVGGFDEAFFDASSRIFFRDDVDLGYRLLDAGYRACKPADVVAWHPPPFYSLRACFDIARRHAMDALLYRKHPRRFRQMLERKRVGPFSFGRPMHYCCVACVAATAGLGMSIIMHSPGGAALFVMSAALSCLVVRFKFQGWRAFHIWNLRDTAAFLIFPWWYAYWLVRGCVRARSWGALW